MFSSSDAAELATRVGFPPVQAPVALSGGNLNHVFRVVSTDGSVVLKHAPPYIASDPSIPLDPSRLDFEVRALRVVPKTARVRCPRVLAHSSEHSVAILEDLGDLPSLEEWLPTGDPGALTDLGAWIARLHQTDGARSFANPSVQATRNQLQYRSVRQWLAAAGAPNPEAAQHAEELGERFMEPGRCLVMGDLWTRSVLVGQELHVIDWELCHFGVPAQDLGHLSAHLWMLEHRTGADGGMQAFLAGYSPTLTADDWRDVNWHSGAEILARTIGGFQRGYLYDGLEPSHPAIRQAVAEALRRLC